MFRRKVQGINKWKDKEVDVRTGWGKETRKEKEHLGEHIERNGQEGKAKEK